MNIKIRETGKREVLKVVDSKTGVEWTGDLIGNAGGFNDGQFTWSEDDDAYLASQDAFDWWDKYIADQEKTESEIEDLADELDIDTSIIRERVEKNTGSDYETHRKEAVRAMTEIKEEYADN
jgi:hypothetical protein